MRKKETRAGFFMYVSCNTNIRIPKIFLDMQAVVLVWRYEKKLKHDRCILNIALHFLSISNLEVLLRIYRFSLFFPSQTWIEQNT